MRREGVYLEDIFRAASDLAEFVAGQTAADVENDSKLRNAMLFSLTVIGEAANSPTADFRAKHPEVRWRDLIALRNRVVHGYFSVDSNLIWQIATAHAPTLREQVAAILREEFPEEP
jgi:uncharacterized protein with HEPN domain